MSAALSGSARGGFRPMLSRDADSMYWMSRYVERAEHLARVLLTTSNLLIDVGDLAPELQQKIWSTVPEIFRIDPPPDGAAAPLSARLAVSDDPASIRACLERARENARAIRDNISAEMWEQINGVYWFVRSDEARARFEESPDDFYRAVLTGSMLFQGLTDQTLPHDQRWHFAQIGKYIERVDVTARIIASRHAVLASASPPLETPIRNINWMSVLRACCSIEAFRRLHVGDMDPRRVAGFLVLNRDFPRSLSYAVRMAYQSIGAIHIDVGVGRIDPAERILGRLAAELEYAEASEIAAAGLGEYLRRVQDLVFETHMAIQDRYFAV